MEQAARGGQEPAQVRSSAGAAQLGPGEGGQLSIRRTRQRSGRAGGSPAPGCGDADAGRDASLTLSGNRRDRDAGRGLRNTSHPAPGHGSCGEAAPWAGARGKQAGGAPPASTRTGRGPQERLDRRACSTGPQRRRRHLASFRPARATGRSSDQPRARPPLARGSQLRVGHRAASAPGSRLCPAIAPRQSRRLSGRLAAWPPPPRQRQQQQ